MFKRLMLAVAVLGLKSLPLKRSFASFWDVIRTNLGVMAGFQESSTMEKVEEYGKRANEEKLGIAVGIEGKGMNKLKKDDEFGWRKR